LTVSGALLDVATTTDVPVLFDSALGQLGLYYRAGDGRFSAVYYDAMTARARRRLPTAASDGSDGGPVVLVARSTEAEFDELHVVADPAWTVPTVTPARYKDAGPGLFGISP
jgi:hypothetical protein